MVYLRLFSLVKLHMSRIMVAVFYLLNTITSTVSPAQPGQERIRLKDSIYSKGKWQYQKVDFAVFKDWSSSMMTYLEELRQGTWGESTYKEVAGTTSYKVAAEKLQAAGFSSDPDYAKHLISIIETYHLSKYDR